jgi:glycerol-3-phosphate acyltransferase PlsY
MLPKDMGVLFFLSMGSYWYVIVALVAYSIGSLSFGAMVAKMKGTDIFAAGSGNPGATNVTRMVGSVPGYAVFALDFLKGFLPTWVILRIFSQLEISDVRIALTALLFLILGHSFSIFYKFRGGKGVSVAMGGLLAVMPRTLLVGILVWAVIFHATRIVSMASLCFTASIPLTAYLFLYPRDCFVFALLLNVIVFRRHKENIVRLIGGTEYKFARKADG